MKSQSVYELLFSLSVSIEKQRMRKTKMKNSKHIQTYTAQMDANIEKKPVYQNAN